MYFLGYDIGSSSVKVCLVEAESGNVVASDYYPKTEMTIRATQPGFAEQNPEDWWAYLQQAHHAVMAKAGIGGKAVKAIGITWQMHGLVIVDKMQNVLRPAIIWCDSRAVAYGHAAFEALGPTHCLSHFLNSPGNFTAAKLAWVKDYEPEIFERIDKILLPGDYIAMKLSGEIGMTVEGLSEGIFWDFKNKRLAREVLDYFDIPAAFIPERIPVFGTQAVLSKEAARVLGLLPGTPITYRAGDQPNNALALNVLNPGAVAANAGTSGVVYGISDRLDYDPKSRVNIFAHVNYTDHLQRLGVLLCINGAGILNSWLKRNLAVEGIPYARLNEFAQDSPIGAKGLSIIPFGNGAERILENEACACSIHGIHFNVHNKYDLLRAAQEGIVFAYEYGMEIMRAMGIEISVIRAGYTNMFLSPIFTQTLATMSHAVIELFDTDGAAGAARAAGLGLGFYRDFDEAFAVLTKLNEIEPDRLAKEETQVAYERWKKLMQQNTETDG